MRPCEQLRALGGRPQIEDRVVDVEDQGPRARARRLAQLELKGRMRRRSLAWLSGSEAITAGSSSSARSCWAAAAAAASAAASSSRRPPPPRPAAAAVAASVAAATRAAAAAAGVPMTMRRWPPAFGGASAESGSESAGGLRPELSLSPRTLTDAAGTLVLSSTAFLRSSTAAVSGQRDVEGVCAPL